MWSPALLGVFLTVGRYAVAQKDQKLNNTSSQSDAYSGFIVATSASTASSSNILASQNVSPSSHPTIALPSLPSSSLRLPISSTLAQPSPSTTPSRPSLSLLSLTRSFDKDNSTALITSSASTSTPCTGCVLEAYNPITTFFDSEDEYNQWTSVVVTETIITQFVTYLVGTSIDTIVTEQQTVNQTKTVVGTANETITHTTPVFYLEPTPGVRLTLNAGPTYVLYNSLWGGLAKTLPIGTATACVGDVTRLSKWQPTRTEDWSYFLETITQDRPQATGKNEPVLLPQGIIQYLQQDLAVQSQYNGSKIATCTLKPTTGLNNTPAKSSARPARPSPAVPQIPEPPQRTTVQETVPVLTQFPSVSLTTGIYLSTTYESTSTHVTRQGCLRCQNPIPPDTPGPGETNKIGGQPANPSQSQYRPSIPGNPPNNPSSPQITPSIPDMIVSIIQNNPSIFPPQQQPPPQQSITIGDSVVPVAPANPTRNPERPAAQNNQGPGVVVGSQTLTPGQTTTINGVPVIVPSDGGGSRIIVGGTTIAVNPSGAPVVIVGKQAVTATVVGGTTAFVFGPSQTLIPGGVVTVSGSTISMPASASGSVLVVNGVTSTLGRGPITAAAGLTINGQTYSPTVRDGTTEYVLGPGTTLKPGDALTISGSTYSLDRSGTALIVNGKTSTIPNIPASNSATTTQSSSATPSVRDVGNFVWSGLGGGGTSSSKAAGASIVSHGGLDKWVESLIIGAAGWLLAIL